MLPEAQRRASRKCYSAPSRRCPKVLRLLMNWLLPMVLVLLAGVVFAAGHFFFVRWMARMSEPTPVADEPAQQRRPGPID